MNFLRRRFLFVVALAVSVALASPADSHAAKKLRWKFRAGEKFRLDMVQTMKMAMSAQGKDINVTSNITAKITWEVKEVSDDGTAKIAFTYDRMVMEMDAPGVGKIKFDSDAKEEPTGPAKQISDSIKPLIGSTLMMKMNRLGTVSDVVVPEGALKGLANIPMLGQMFSKEGFKSMMQQSAIQLPEEAIDSGHTWKRESEINSPVGKMKTTSTFTYRGEEVRDGVKLAKIGIQVKLDIGKGGLLPGTIKIKDQDNSGTMFFDIQSGRLVETVMNQKMTMEISVLGNTFDQKITSTMKMTMKPAKSK